MHHIYHTKAVVLGYGNIGEANRLYELYTEDFGLIIATAQGTRRLQSRQRYALQEGSVIKVDLIRGKEFWRIGSVSTIGTLFSEDVSWNKMIGKWLRLVRRLIHGEGTHERLFADVLAIENLEKNMYTHLYREYEIILIVRLLHILGYWDHETSDTNLLDLDIEQMEQVIAQLKREEYVERINMSLGQTQL